MRRLFVIFNTAEVIHEGFGKMEEFSDRPQNELFTNIYKVKDEIFTFPYGEQWKENKKFAMQALRSFGFGTASIESKVSTETQILHDFLISKQEKPVNPKEFIPKVCLNVILSILVNTRYEWDDPTPNNLIKLVRDFFGFFEDTTAMSLFEYFPKLASVVYHKKVGQMKTVMKRFREFIKTHIDQHRETFDPLHTRDALDVYLKEGKLDTIGEEALTDTILMFMPDAFETNSNVLLWTLLYITSHPDVQNHIHKELDDIIGQGRLPSLNDRAQMPYLEAALVEAMRTSNAIGTTAEHKALRDIYFKGFFIPESATVLGNITNVHHNSDVYPEPLVYKPERFLGENGKKLQREHFMPFGVGRRMCMGESLIRMENFLIVASLLQRFSLSFPSNEPPPSLVPAVKTVFVMPVEYKVVFKLR